MRDGFRVFDADAHVIYPKICGRGISTRSS